MSDPTPDQPQPPERRGGIGNALGLAMTPLAGVQAALRDLTGDLRTIADAVQELPEMLAVLRSIESRVERLDAEVVEMHAAVERMDRRFVALNEEVDTLGVEIAGLRRTMSPLRRVGQRFRRRSGGELDEPPDAQR